MNLKKILIITGVLITSSVVLAGCTLPFQPPKKSGLQVTITGNDKASVFLDDNHLGTTPFTTSDLKPGSYSLKLAPEDQTKKPYVTTVTLSPGLLSAINWTFGLTADESGGEVFELSSITDKNKAELSLITIPDNVIVKVDGASKGFSPMTLDDLTEGAHALTVTAPGYVERTSNPKLTKGYKLTVTLKLGRQPLSQVQPTPTPTPMPTASATPTASIKPSPTATQSGVTTINTTVKPYVQILDNPLGWLRVRAEASSASLEIGKLSVRSTVPYLDTLSGWYKIQLNTTTQGWISSDAVYTKLVQ